MLRTGDRAEFLRRIELSARYGPLRRPKDRAWRVLLWNLRRTPGVLEHMLALKERRAISRRRKS
jgi:hypothetical protein